MYCSLSPNDSTLDYPNMSSSNVMKQFACGLLSLNRNVQIMLIRPHKKNFKYPCNPNMIHSDPRHWYGHN